MRYDNEEAWFKACRQASGMAPIDVFHCITDGKRFKNPQIDIAREVNGMVVQMLRGALTVHRRVTEDGAAAPFDSLLAYRMEQASKELPEGWQLVVSAKRGEVRVDLYNDADELQPVRVTEDISESAMKAILFATAIRPKTNAALTPAEGSTT